MSWRPISLLLLLLLTIIVPSPARADPVALCVSVDPPDAQPTGDCGETEIVFMSDGSNAAIFLRTCKFGCHTMFYVKINGDPLYP